MAFNNEKSSIEVTENQRNLIKITQNMNEYIFHFTFTPKTQSLTLSVKTDSKFQIKISYKKIIFIVLEQY